MNDLDQLKKLLFGAEKEALDSITERVERREARAEDVADILPEAIHQSHMKNGELVDSLTAPVGECLQRALHEDPETYGNALYPVMGPAIRKSIMATLRNFAQQINEAVEHSVSPRGLKWRIQASRAGIPFGEYVLQKTMQYRVEQAYLISRENGLLISHVHHEASKIKDSDAVSAMFTAIQDFVKESFSPDRTGRLESADMGEFTLWAVHGPHALLVCVIRGVPPKAMRADLSAILERIHFRYGDAIRDYKGDTGSFAEVESDLERCLQFEARRERDDRPGSRILWIAAIAVLLTVVGLSGYRSWSLSQQLDRLHAVLKSTPGIHVTEISRSGTEFTVRGLRDPLAVTISDVATTADVDASRIKADMQPFQSLQREIIASRARTLLAPPPSAQLTVAGSTLVVSGDAPWAWHRQLENRYPALAGISTLDVSSLTITDRGTIVAQVEQLDRRTFQFVSGISLMAEADNELRKYADALRRLRDDAAAVAYSIDVAVYGSTDETGGEAVNAGLAKRRALVVADVLAEYGIPVTLTGRVQDRPDPDVPGNNSKWRFVRVDLTLRSNPGQQ